jgi:amidase
MKIGVVREGFGRPNADPDVEAKVGAGADLFRRLGATVHEVSVPWHRDAGAVWVPIGVDGLTHTMMLGDGYGASRPDLYVTSLMDAFRAWRTRAHELPDTVKLHLLLGAYVRKHYGTRYYGKAVNLARLAAAGYDSVLAECDLLLMPTTPMKATPLPPPDASPEEYHRRAREPTSNTMPFNITHHPAMSIPCGMSDGLPVGMMLVGRHWDEAAIYRAAYAFERAEDWRIL